LQVSDAGMRFYGVTITPLLLKGLLSALASALAVAYRFGTA